MGTNTSEMKIREILILGIFLCVSLSCRANERCTFKVLAFYTAKNDAAHISFVREANTWFSKTGHKFNFCYEATDNWNLLNEEYLSAYQVVIFLDTRPENPLQRSVFEKYMKNGGGWLGFHFSAFALSPSSYPNNWDWYQNSFLACGAYSGNTWRPTAATLKVENRDHPITRKFPKKIKSTPNEWYKWEKDLQTNTDIEILLSIHPKSFPLGTGPKPHEIWHSGYYPVVWTNKKYRMVYFNMGHNDIDYENGTHEELSLTFGKEDQNRLILNALLWAGKRNVKT